MTQLQNRHRYGVYLILETSEVWSEVGNSRKLYAFLMRHKTQWCGVVCSEGVTRQAPYM